MSDGGDLIGGLVGLGIGLMIVDRILPPRRRRKKRKSDSDYYDNTIWGW